MLHVLCDSLLWGFCLTQTAILLGAEDYSNFGSGPLPSVAVCCQQEIHATLLAREAHNIQIEANRALSAALAGIDRDVEGADELVRGSLTLICA